MINWESQETELLLNPRMPEEKRHVFQEVLRHSSQFPGHLWLSTSGSTELKLVALSKEAILHSARAVNFHLQSHATDIWINPLPLFHVGGLGIFARGHTSGASVIAYSEKWNPLTFLQRMSDASATLTALVPTQLFDLVNNHLQAPKHLRAVIIGGGALGDRLYADAMRLGWNPLPSYGMTETASQVATAPLSSLDRTDRPSLEVLSHMDVTTEREFLTIRSLSLLTAYAVINGEGSKMHLEFKDPKLDGKFVTEDCGVVIGKELKVFGRMASFIKVGGESVHMKRLEEILEQVMLEHSSDCDLALIALPDERLGHAIHLAASGASRKNITYLSEKYDQRVMPFERIRRIHIVDRVPRSPLHKLLKQELIQLLQFGLEH